MYVNRVKATLAYDGTNYAGYQSQPNARTVQEMVDKALQKMHKDDQLISYASGRTDAGVHANGQVIHFDTPLTIEPYRWIRALNVLLPLDIRVVNVEYVDQNFHARYSATGKTYRYKWSMEDIQNPFERNYYVHLGWLKPNIDKMREAAQYLMGTHDFTSFCSTRANTTTKVRTVRMLTIEQEGHHLIMTIEGDGFLYNMVRTIAGMLLSVGIGKHQPEDIRTILEMKNRKKAGKTASAHGLYLESVTYDPVENVLKEAPES